MPVMIIDNFSRGIDRRTFGKEDNPSAAWDIRNYDIDQYGRLVKRDGYTRLTAEIVATTTVPGIFATFNLNRNRREIYVILSNNSVNLRADDGTNISTWTSVVTTTRDIQWGNIRSIVVHTLGTEYIRFKYDDTDFGSTLLAPPTFTPTLTAAAGGSLDTNSWYRYRFTYVETQSIGGQTLPIATESIPRTNTKTATTFDVQLTGSNNQVNIASLSGSTEISATRIYRSHGQPTRAALDTVETYFLAQQSDALTTYTDTTADSALGGLLDTYDHDRLGTDVLASTNRLRALVIWNNRIWVSKDTENKVICSKRLSQDGYLGVVGDPYPYVFPSENQIEVGIGDGDNITAMAVFRGELIIFKRYSTWVISGANSPNNPPDDIGGPRRLFGDVGCYADKSLANSGDRLTWLSHRGVYSYDGSSLEFVGDGIQDIIGGATQTNQMEASAVWLDRENEYWLAINDAEITATQDRIFVYDFYRRYWRSHVLGSTISSLAILIPQTTTQTPLVLAGSDNESFVYRLLNGSVDTVAGAPTEIVPRWQSHYLGLASAGRFANDRGGAVLGNYLSRKKVKKVWVKSVLSSDTDRRPSFATLLESDNGAESNTITITPSSRVDILGNQTSLLHVGNDLRIQVTHNTRSGDANFSDSAIQQIGLEFDEANLR